MNSKQFEDLYQRWLNKNPNQKFWTEELAKEFNASSAEALRGALKRYRKNNPGLSNKPDKIFEEIRKQGKNNFKESTEIHGNGEITSERIIAIENKDLKDPTVMLKLHGFDENLWELKWAKNNYWSMSSNDSDDGRIIHYQSKITVCPKETPTLNKDSLKKILDTLVSNYQFPILSAKKYSKGHNLLLIGLADLHYALKSELATSGNEYDEKIAETRFDYIINDIISKVKDRGIEKIIFFNGGDLFNVDNKSGTTTKGTQLSSSINYFDMLTQGSQMIIRGIDKLLSVAPVEYITALSNHDLHTIYALSLILNAWYRDNPNVIINVQSLERFYTSYGNSLIGLTHDLNPKHAHRLMSEESGFMWNLPFRYYFCGHLHTEYVVTDGSVEIRRLTTPSSISDWSYSNGYVGNIKKSQSFIINDEFGLTDCIYSIIKE